MAVERLDKNKHFQKKKSKKCVKNFGWAVKNGLKGIYYFFGNDLTKTPETKKLRKGQVCGGRRRIFFEKVIN